MEVMFLLPSNINLTGRSNPMVNGQNQRTYVLQKFYKKWTNRILDMWFKHRQKKQKLEKIRNTRQWLYLYLFILMLVGDISPQGSKVCEKLYLFASRKVNSRNILLENKSRYNLTCIFLKHKLIVERDVRLVEVERYGSTLWILYSDLCQTKCDTTIVALDLPIKC